MLLQPQKFDLEFQLLHGKSIPLADALSRKFSQETYPEICKGLDAHVFSVVETLPVRKTLLNIVNIEDKPYWTLCILLETYWKLCILKTSLTEHCAYIRQALLNIVHTEEKPYWKVWIPKTNLTEHCAYWRKTLLNIVHTETTLTDHCACCRQTQLNIVHTEHNPYWILCILE